MQTFENNLSELEPPDSLKQKIHEINQRIRDIAKKSGEIHAKQMDIANEREQYQDTIR